MYVKELLYFLEYSKLLIVLTLIFITIFPICQLLYLPFSHFPYLS